LHHVVAKHILHQLNGVWLDFRKDLIPLIAVGRLEFALDESGSLLVAAELNNVVPDILIVC
jgi:hypothetical protein